MKKGTLSHHHGCAKMEALQEGSEFTIRTDQQSIKHLLKQRIQTFMQAKGIVRLLGLNYKIA